MSTQFLKSVSSLTLVRLALFFHILVSFGLGSDFAWHMRYWGEDLFKVAHLVMWASMALMVLTMLVLKIRKYPIPWHLFVLFPLWVFLYIYTDEFLDEHFDINSGTFWTPFRLTWGPMVLYHLYWLHKIAVETNEYILMYMRTLLYFVLPLRYLYFVFTPFAMFSIHTELHGLFSPLASLIVPFGALVVYKIQRYENIVLPGVILLASLREPYTQYFFHIENWYKGPAATFVIFGLLFFMIALSWYSRVGYALLGVVTMTLIFFTHFMWTGTFVWYQWALCASAAVVLTQLFYEYEAVLVRYGRKWFRV